MKFETPRVISTEPKTLDHFILTDRDIGVGIMAQQAAIHKLVEIAEDYRKKLRSMTDGSAPPEVQESWKVLPEEDKIDFIIGTFMELMVEAAKEKVTQNTVFTHLTGILKGHQEMYPDGDGSVDNIFKSKEPFTNE